MKRFIYIIVIALLGYSCGDDNNDFSSFVSDDVEEDEDIANNTSRIPCQNGFADIFPCDGYDLMAHISLEEFGSSGGNDSWGWTDPATGVEYAIMGLEEGTAFIDISSPTNPVFVGRLPSASGSSLWRDIKVFNNHAFIVSEASGHGMQVFDLTRLRNPIDDVQVFDADALYTEFGNAHNIVINEATGFAYAVGTQTFDGSPHFINIQDPTNPIAAGGFADGTYTHDAQVVTYSGPDPDYQDREIFVGSNETEIVVIDVTDKENPLIISQTTYQNVGYTHQGWFTDDQRFFIANDELDEMGFGFNTRTLIFDFEDLDNPSFQDAFMGPTEAIDHNLYVRDNELFLSNYTAGVRVADISQITVNNVFDIGFFDTYPEGNTTNFNGVWNVYPFFESGNIIISDLDRGFFIIRRTGT